MTALEANTAMLRCVAEKLGPLRDQVVFTGGTILPFLLTEQPTWEMRRAKDVDFIAGFASKEELYEFEDQMWDRGFKKLSTGAVCHWILGRIPVDVLPTDPAIVGFGNLWFAEGTSCARRVDIGGGLTIGIVNAPVFIALKFEAFGRRRKNDFLGSYDLGDIIRVIYGRENLTQEVRGEASPELRQYLSLKFNNLLDNTGLRDIVRSHLPEENATAQAIDDVIVRIEEMAK